MHPNHHNFLRIVWKNNPSGQIKKYQLTTVTYGTSSAPYLAIKTLQKLANVDASICSLASKVLLSDFYVDDWMMAEKVKKKLFNKKMICVIYLKKKALVYVSGQVTVQDF